MTNLTPSQSVSSDRGVFGSGSNYDQRYIPDQKRLAELAEACKTMGLKVVLTMGSFDLIHIGHFLYLEKARSHGDVLIVGIDSDEKIRARKGPDRPVVSEDERVRMLTHVRHVDMVTVKPANAPKWELIKLLRPDVLVATEDTYTPEQLEALKEFCGEVVVLERQATTSTTAKLRRLNIGLAQKMKAAVAEAVESVFDRLGEEETKAEPEKFKLPEAKTVATKQSEAANEPAPTKSAKEAGATESAQGKSKEAKR